MLETMIAKMLGEGCEIWIRKDRHNFDTIIEVKNKFGVTRRFRNSSTIQAANMASDWVAGIKVKQSRRHYKDEDGV